MFKQRLCLYPLKVMLLMKKFQLLYKTSSAQLRSASVWLRIKDMFWIVWICSDEALIKIWLKSVELFLSVTGVLDDVLHCLGML